MEELDNLIAPQISYLQARDPSILSWNRHGIDKVRHNLVTDFDSESTISSVPSEKEDKHIQVYLRVKSNVDYEDIYTIENDTLICRVPEGSYCGRNHRDYEVKKYKFTHIFRPEASQEDLFNQIIKPKILNFINGHTSTLLAYGASGAGKTFTMVGTAEQPGIIPRALEYLFRTIPVVANIPEVKPQLNNGKMCVLTDSEKKLEQQNLHSILLNAYSEKSVHIKTYKAMQQRLSRDPVATVGQSPPILSVYVSFAEIYNEFIYDLLQSSPSRGQQRPKLKIGGLQDQIYIKGLKCISVSSGLEAYQVLQYGINNLKYADTAVNMHSSRSHCIFTIRLVQGFDVENSHVSTFNFCDLAGSERVKKTMNVGDRLKESNNINSSLLVLGRCISATRDGQHNKENKVPPFRESKLTQIFQRALMGKEDIFMIVNINPSRYMFDESQHTLNFAGIAQEIVVEEPPKKILKSSRFSDALPNIKDYGREEELSKLREENENLGLELSQLRRDQISEIEAEREHIRNLYETLLDRKEKQNKRLEDKLKKLLEEKATIVISDEDSDEENEQLLNLRSENQKLKQELKRKEANIAHLHENLDKSKQTTEEAIADFITVSAENEELRLTVRDLKTKLYNLENKFHLITEEVEYLRQAKVMDQDKIEMLEDENQVLKHPTLPMENSTNDTDLLLEEREETLQVDPSEERRVQLSVPDILNPPHEAPERCKNSLNQSP